MIEGRVRELVAEVISTTGSRSLAEQIDDITELEHVSAMVQAALSVRTAAFAEARRREDVAGGSSSDEAGRGASVEVAMARRVSKATVDHHLAFAEPLIRDHPQLLAACLDGRVSQPAAKASVAACQPLDPERRRAIDAELTALAMQNTPGQMRKATDRMVASVDPEASAKRARLARAKKQVRAIMNGDGTGTLLANLPAEQAVACWQTLDHEARGMRADGDDRSIRELMCDLMVERLTGQAKAADLHLEVGAVIATSSLLVLDDQPGRLIGVNGGDYGVLPAHIVRQLATSKNAWWRRLVCDPVDGRLVTMDTTKRRFTGALRKFVILRDGTSRRPFSDSPVYDIDHIDRHVDGGPTSASNGQGVAVFDHHLRDLPGWTVTGNGNQAVRWMTPTGHTYTSRPPPILGLGNTRSPARRWRPHVEIHTHPTNLEYTDKHRRRRTDE